MNKKISEVLRQIEHDNDVRIIYACESGSRAWGFASQNSDFDVRFIYMHNRDWYLSIAEKRDVIELPVDEILDVNGWDIRKALQLLRRSNAPLMEWLVSPIKYFGMDAALTPLLELSRKAFLPDASFHHYLSMAKNNLIKVQETETPKIKTYLYALRPLLCGKWIKEFGDQPPMLIDDLLSAFLPDTRSKIRRQIDNIITLKKEGIESVAMGRSTLLENYLMSQLSELSNYSPYRSKKEHLESFDSLFREMIELYLKE